MPKPKPTDGAKAQPRKARTQTHTAKEAVQRMFAAGGHVDRTMMENTMEEASESMQDVSEMASKMETEEQKKRERTPKQMQATSTVTSDTASPEQKKTRNKTPSNKLW